MSTVSFDGSFNGIDDSMRQQLMGGIPEKSDPVSERPESASIKQPTLKEVKEESKARMKSCSMGGAVVGLFGGAFMMGALSAVGGATVGGGLLGAVVGALGGPIGIAVGIVIGLAIGAAYAHYVNKRETKTAEAAEEKAKDSRPENEDQVQYELGGVEKIEVDESLGLSVSEDPKGDLSPDNSERPYVG